MQRITDIHIKPVKKQKAVQREKIRLLENFGPEGDAYSGPGDRQITLLGRKDLEELKKDMDSGICISRFTPNITVSGSSKQLKKGKKYSLGETEIIISSVTKKCHDGCRLREKEKKICLLPGTARFASILKSGTIRIGDTVIEL